MNAPVHIRTTYPLARSLVLFAREETCSYQTPARGPRTSARPALAPETASDWTEVHQRIVLLGIDRAAHERELCRWLLCAERLGVHARAGYASLSEYVERILGLNRRQTEERLRVGRALADLPVLDDAFASGKLCWSAVRELTRVASKETELAWLGWAKGQRIRAIERAVAQRHRGDGPKDPADPSLVKHRIRFEVRAETMALFRDLQAAVRADLGGEVDDDSLLYEIARRALGGPGDEGRASYQVAVTRCDACGQTSIDAGGHSQPVDDAVAEMAACDSQEIGCVDGGPHVGAAPASTPRPRASQTIPPAIRRQVLRRDRKRCVVVGCANHRFLDVHHLDPRSEGGSHDPDRLATLCGNHHRAAHAGKLCVDGTAKSGFVFRHADGARYGTPLSPPAIDVVVQVQSALEDLGFKATRARALIDAVLRVSAPQDPAALLHAALRAS